MGKNVDLGIGPVDEFSIYPDLALPITKRSFDMLEKGPAEGRPTICYKSEAEPVGLNFNPLFSLSRFNDGFQDSLIFEAIIERGLKPLRLLSSDGINEIRDGMNKGML